MVYRNPLSLSFTFLTSFLFVLISLFVSEKVLQAAQISGLFNTGLNEKGAILPVGDVDLHYELIGPASPAHVISPHPVWVPGARRAAWIGPRNGNQPAPAGTYTYALVVDLTDFDPTTAVITGTWATDNTGEIFLNGVSTGITKIFVQFESLEDFSISGNFVEGLNVLEFVVNNIGGVSNPTGLLVANLSGQAELRSGICNGIPATITGSDDDDIITGTDSDDVIQGLDGNDIIYGLGGNDVICGGGGHDTLLGGDGDDELLGNAGHDVLVGESGSDLLLGGPGNDSLIGGPGDDQMTGGSGPDVCDGGTHSNGDMNLGSCNLTVNIP